MSLSRAFTTRKLRMSTSDASDGTKTPQRAHTLRHKISAPMQLIHTTNMLSYNAPDLPRPVINTSPVSTSSSSGSEDDSHSVATVETTPPTSPDVGKGERSASPKPKQNHLSDFFRNPGKPLFPPEEEPAPAIPQRSPSHTKKNSYEALARSASVSRLSRDSEASARAGRTFSRSPSTSTRASSVSGISSTRSLKHPVSPAPLALALSNLEESIKEAHPFGPELAQVTELAEEYCSSGGLDSVDEDAEYLESRGLAKLSADDYLGAIHGVSSYFFPETAHLKPAPLWI
ncbi:hypothetical protein PT974_08860 [Cladobotryum mycophilum]|uniref:Uncharacterized protein n=1 Tax=Cladobotryum mycophilum TaxID=491253 RepID=A0ABR0SFX9_9HYPO